MPKSLEDIFNDDLFGLLESKSEKIGRAHV